MPIVAITRLCCVESSVARRSPSRCLLRTQIVRASSVKAAATRPRASVDAEFVMASSNVLHQRMSAHDDAGRAVTFQAAHRSEPGLEPAVIALDPIVRILVGVVERGRDQVIERGTERRRAVGDDLDRRTVRDRAPS